MIYPNYEDLNSGNCVEKSIKKHYFEFWQFLIDNYDQKLSWSEKLYWFYNEITNYPKCPVCGNLPGFINFRIGYKKYCCAKCSNNCPEKKLKTKNTNNDRYGGNAPASSQKIIDKMKSTTMKRYGVENVQHLSNVVRKASETCNDRYGGRGNSSTILKNKYIKTCNERYGCNNPMQNEKVQLSFQKKFKDKYGVNYPVLLEKCINKLKESKKKHTLSTHINVVDTSGNTWICKCPHPGCDKCTEKIYITKSQIFLDRMRDGTEPCTRLLPIDKDRTKNTSLEVFVKQILEEYNIPYISNDRNILKPKEVDIYIPSHNLAIECNGVFSHSIKYKPNNYHIHKNFQCRSNGVELLHIWEDWIKNKPEIVKSILLSKLDLIDKTIYARNTKVEIIQSKVCNKFLDENHIQGRASAGVHLGLYYGEELVSVMLFTGKKNDGWELTRFCSKLNIRVIGGASKLLKYFIKYYKPRTIISFSSNDISSGQLYKKLGFASNQKYNQSYWYIEPGTLKRYHRSSWSKSEIVRKGIKDKIDDTWTEKEVMEELGFFCIYDSGQFKWILDLTKTS